MATTLFHWTLHPWAIYAVVGLAIAYSTFRKRRRQTISAVFAPLIGERHANGASGRVIDILAIFATLFGSAASLGLGALQIGTGFTELDWMDKVSDGLLVAIIAVLTVAFVASAVSGVEKGIQWLSNINMVLALILAVFVFIAGPTIIVLDLLPTSIVAYLGDLPQLAGRTEASGGEGVADWLGSWTVFYWAWWISWTPFVGMFIARISRGRTIRQFVGGVILVPSTVSLVWFAIFGGTAMKLKESGAARGGVDARGPALRRARRVPHRHRHQPARDDPRRHLLRLRRRRRVHRDGHALPEGRPRTGPVRGRLLGRGDRCRRRRHAARRHGEGDALTGLQNLTILVAAPFVLVMIGMCVALMRDLRQDPLIVRGRDGRRGRRTRRDRGPQAVRRRLRDPYRPGARYGHGGGPDRARPRVTGSAVGGAAGIGDTGS